MGNYPDGFTQADHDRAFNNEDEEAWQIVSDLEEEVKIYSRFLEELECAEEVLGDEIERMAPFSNDHAELVVWRKKIQRELGVALKSVRGAISEAVDILSGAEDELSTRI